MAKSKPKSKSKGPKKAGGVRSGKKGKGKKGGKKGKSKSKKKLGKKKAKKEVTVVDLPPPPPDVYFWVRRLKTSVLIETFEEQLVPDFKAMLGEIIGKPVDSFTVFKDDAEMVDAAKGEGPSKEGKGKGGGGGSKTSKGSKGSKGKKGKKGGKGKGKGKKGKGKGKGGKGGGKDDGSEKGSEAEGPPPPSMKLVDYGINSSSSSIFNPLTLAYVYKDEATGGWEEVDITPWTKPVEIPEIVKQYLRNYKDVYTADAPSPDEVTPGDEPEEKSGGRGRRGK